MRVVPPKMIPLCGWHLVPQLMLYEEILGRRGAQGHGPPLGSILPGKKLRAQYDLTLTILRGQYSAGYREGKTPRHAFEDAWDNSLLLQEYEKLMRMLSSKAELLVKFSQRFMAGTHLGGRVDHEDYIQTLSLNTGGYVLPQA